MRKRPEGLDAVVYYPRLINSPTSLSSRVPEESRIPHQGYKRGNTQNVRQSYGAEDEPAAGEPTQHASGGSTHEQTQTS
ncbi:unnamed protein product [Pieris macdunnoughi]|uniref:Uncharacterized protein n=1 Tax=Pieris macdunnoughi TaxID=345717 RepID=A0A821LUQ5_9NEOP|nr:unnamed protein product [Pieris macdunnoughi]